MKYYTFESIISPKEPLYNNRRKIGKIFTKMTELQCLEMLIQQKDYINIISLWKVKSNLPRILIKNSVWNSSSGFVAYNKYISFPSSQRSNNKIMKFAWNNNYSNYLLQPLNREIEHPIWFATNFIHGWSGKFWASTRNWFYSSKLFQYYNGLCLTWEDWIIKNFAIDHFQKDTNYSIYRQFFKIV